MHRRHVLAFVATLLIAWFSLHATDVRAQQKPLQEQLIGTWSFVASVDAKSSRSTERWGIEPKGILVFDRNGRYVQMIMRSDTRTFGAKSVAQFGTYVVNEADRTIVTQIEGSSLPARNGTSQTRSIISLTATELKYSNITRTAGARAVVWKRLH